MRSLFSAISTFYLQGFRSMGLGRTLWAIILLKLFILFAVLKPFFFPDYLKSRFASESERGDHVLARLVGASGNDLTGIEGAAGSPGAVPQGAGGRDLPAAGVATRTERR